MARKPRLQRKKLWEDHKAPFTGSIRVFPRHGPVPRRGPVRPKEPTEQLQALLEERKARMLSAPIARAADRWYGSLTGEVERPDPPLRQGEPVGVDLGLTFFRVLSTPVEAAGPPAAGIEEPRQRGPAWSPAASSDPEPAPGLLAPGDHLAGENPAGHRGGGPGRAGSDTQSALPLCGGRQLGRLPADAGVHGPVVRLTPHHSAARFPITAALRARRAGGPPGVAVLPGVSLRGGRASARPGPERGAEFAVLGVGPPERLSREFPGKERLWRSLWRRNGPPWPRLRATGR